MRPISRYIALFVLILLVSAVSLRAQAQRSSVTVTVHDPLGAVSVKAEVSLFRVGKLERVEHTNKDGIAVFDRLSEGEYLLVVNAAGFEEYKSELFTVKGGEPQRLEVALSIKPINSNVDITSDDSDATSSGSTTLTPDEIANLPTDPEQLKAVLQQMAGESITGGDMPITVNGIPGGAMPPKNAIKSVRINRNVFSAQYENTYGGGIEIFTSPSDKISGWVSFNFADSRFNASDPFLSRRVPFQSRAFYFGLSGPIGKKTHYFFSGSHEGIDSSSVINAKVLDGSLNIVEFRTDFATPGRSDSGWFTLDSEPNKKHKLYLIYNVDISRQKNSGVGGFTLPERAANNNTQDHSLSFSDTFTPNAKLVNVTKFSFAFNGNRYFGGSDSVAINVSDAFSGGGPQTDQSTYTSHFELYNDTTRSFKKFTLGFGAMVRGYRVSETSRSDFGGSYTFSGRTAPVLDASNNPVLDQNGNAILEQISSIESYRRTLLFRQLGLSPAEVRTLGGGADQFTISGGQPSVKGSQVDYAAYIQASYTLNETSTVSFGLRYENQTNIKNRSNFAPRFGFMWSPKEKPKQKAITVLPRVTFGAGLFYARYGLDNFITRQQANDPDRVSYFVTEPTILDQFPAVPAIDSLEQTPLLKSRRLIDPRFQTPLSLIFNVTVSKKLPAKFSANISISHTHMTRAALTTNINAPLAGSFPLSPVYPFGGPGTIYDTVSAGRNEATRFTASLNFPNWKLQKKGQSSMHIFITAIQRPGETWSAAAVRPTTHTTLRRNLALTLWTELTLCRDFWAFRCRKNLILAETGRSVPALDSTS